MTSRELTSGFDFWSHGYLRMAVVHLPKLITMHQICMVHIRSFRNSIWLPPPSLISVLSEVGTVDWCLSAEPNFVQISIVVPEINACSRRRLMTSRELFSDFNVCLRGYLRMTMTHLPICKYLHTLQRQGHFLKLKMAAAAMKGYTKGCTISVFIFEYFEIGNR